METGTATLMLDDALFTLLMHVGLNRAREKLPAMVQKFPLTTLKLATHAHGVELRGLGPIKPVFQPSIDTAGQVVMGLQVNVFDLGALGDVLAKQVNEQIAHLRQMVEAQGLHFHLHEVQTKPNELVIIAEIANS
jgi:hypothetical protein